MALMAKITTRCPTCLHTKKAPGLLWLGGNDYVECPDCEGHPGTFIMYEERIVPKTIVLVQGWKPTGPIIGVT
jgi:hypothetical protein